jgi:hypothetical protein
MNEDSRTRGMLGCALVVIAFLLIAVAVYFWAATIGAR